MNINNGYTASKLQSDISNMVLVSTTFTDKWNKLTGERFSQNSENLAKAGKDLYQHTKEYFETANKLIQNSNTPQAQRVAKDIASVNRRLGDAIEKLGTEAFKQAAENTQKAAKAMTNAKVATGAGSAVSLTELAVAVNNAVKTGDWEGVGESASGLAGSIAGSAAGAKIATIALTIMASAGMVVSTPVVIGVVATAAAAGAFFGSESGKRLWDWTKDIRDDLSDTMADVLTDFFGLPRSGEYHIYDPLVLDLDGNGIIDIQAINGYKGAMFDHDGDGIATATSWIGSKDGLLVFDKNNDGIINSGRELFGDSTLIDNDTLAKHGYEALAKFDDNHDGVIDVNDTAFGSLKVWQDKNGDGISTFDELIGLSSLGIDRLFLEHSDVNQVFDNATIIKQGKFSQNGKEQLMADMGFNQNTIYSRHTDKIELTDAQKGLPTLNGMGRLRDLRQASALSDKLTDILTQYQTATTKTAQLALLPALIQAWSDTDKDKDDSFTPMFSQAMIRTPSAGIGLTPTQANTLSTFSIDIALQSKLAKLADKIAILDSFAGTKTDKLYIANHSQAEQILDSIDKTYHSLQGSIYQSLLTQTRLSPYFEKIALVFDGKAFYFDYSALKAFIDSKHQSDPQNAFVDLAELLVYGGINAWDEGRTMLSSFATQAQDKGVLDDYLALLDNATINKLATQQGGDTDDVLTAVGILNQDVLYGNGGNDTLVAGTKTSILTGGTGSDRYIYQTGFGDSIIDNQDTSHGRFDTIVLDFVKKSQLSYERVGDSLVIHVAGQNGVITVKDMFVGDTLTHHIDQITLKDATISLQQISTQLLKGTNKDDTIIGFGTDDIINGQAGNDTIQGRGGSDTIYAGMGNDHIDAGAGNDTIYLISGSNYAYGGDDNDVIYSGIGHDTLEGGIGSDVYVFGRNFGQDQIINFNPNHQDNDVIQFTDGIRLNQLNFSRHDNHLIIGQKYTNNHIKVTNFFDKDTMGDFAIQKVVGADGVSIDTSQIKQIVSTASFGNDILYADSTGSRLDGKQGNDSLIGGSGDDVLIGGIGNDTLRGNKGDDWLIGGTQSDTYLYQKGDGKDTIVDVGGINDILKMQNLTLAQLNIEKHNHNLWVNIKGSNEGVIIENYFANSQFNNHSFAKFGTSTRSNGANVIEQIILDDMTLRPQDVYQMVYDTVI